MFASRIVRIGAELQADRPGNKDDWQAMGYNPLDHQGFLSGYKIPSMPPPLSIGRLLLADYITQWLELTGVQPLFYWSRGKKTLHLGSQGTDTLLATLGVQILLMINSSAGFSFCSNCGRPFLLKIGQSVSRNTYCDFPNCRTAARRAAQKRYMLRERLNPLREKRPKTKLTNKQVEVILSKCNKHTEGKYPPGFIKGLAEKYKVSVSLIYKIAEGKTRTNVK